MPDKNAWAAAPPPDGYDGRMTRPVILIVLAQLFGTSLWFSANGVGTPLMQDWHLSPADLGTLTSAVQVGFITGTLLFAITGLADRFGASRIFLVASLVGATANLALAWLADDLLAGISFRFITGMALAGIYPIGMKLVVSWAPERRGEALAWLVGMLTLGTATPHLLRALGTGIDWPWIISLASLLALIGGLMVARLGDGPHLVRASRLIWGGVFSAFRRPGFRAAAFGYFGHMWELYAFWVLVPLFLAAIYPDAEAAQLSLLAFLVIGLGAASCVVGGRLSTRLGSAPVAAIALATSAGLCLLYPWISEGPATLATMALFLWGLAVIADSAQFSALATRHAPADGVASALAIMNGIGFALSALAIPLVTTAWESIGPAVSWLLLPGAVFGLWSLRPLLANRSLSRPGND